MSAPLALRIALALAAVCLLPGLAAFAQPPIVHCNRPGIVFIADGSGGLPGPSPELCKLVGWYCPGLRSEVVDWTWGYGMVALDMWGHRNHRTQGQELAERVMAYRVACPTGRVYLVGHSSGAAVVLAAALHLPPGSITGVILLAPSVSWKYDLCPALAAASDGVDVFHSKLDFINLTFTVTGTSDRRYLVGSAGFHGFRDSGACADLFANLRQHPNSYTGHFGCIQRDFLVGHVLPILQTCTAIVGPDGTTSEAAGGVRSTSQLSPAAREQALLDQLVPLEDVAETPPTAAAPSRGGNAPISDSLRLP